MPIKTVSTFWLVAASFCASLGWLLPNNFPPLLSFHKEAWVGAFLIVPSAWVLLTRRTVVPVHLLAVVVVICAAIPWLQYAGGMIPFFGDAWFQTLYLMGFLLAMLVGEKWERETPGQCLDFVCLAVAIASVASTSIQLHQWLALKTEAGQWILGNGLPNRYYANLAQPNLLSSLLLLGVLACFWGYYRQKIAGWVATVVAVFILFGVVLTASRTAWISIILLTVATHFLRSKLPSSMKIWVVPVLAGYFYVISLAMPSINQFLSIPEHDFSLELRGMNDNARLAGWKMLLDASTLQPWLGFGWGQIAQATFSVVARYPAQNGIFTHAHNLVLDLILWNGYPLGLVLTAFLVWWLLRVLKKAETVSQYLVIGALIVLGIHSLLEFPLTYAYFLLPLGLLLGTLNASLGFRPVFVLKSWVGMVLWALTAVALSLTIKDYFRVETSFYGLRFESRGIPSSIPKTPPDVLVLTQWREVVAFSRNVPRSGVSETELARMRGVVTTLPTPITMNKLAANLALNNYPQEAFEWLTISCKTYPEAMCNLMGASWRKESLANPLLAAIPWPKIVYPKKE